MFDIDALIQKLNSAILDFDWELVEEVRDYLAEQLKFDEFESKNFDEFEI